MKDKINKLLKPFNIEIHGKGFIEKLKNQSAEKNEFDKQFELLNGNAKIIFDIGSNRGDVTSTFLKYYKKADIHAFEPFADSNKIFLEKHSTNKSVHLNQIALTNYIGTAKLSINKSVDTNSLLKSKEIGASSDKSCITESEIEIETNTIDNYCLKNNIDQIDILKIDVQGSELNVLKGAEKMLTSNRIKLIFLETYFEQQYEGQPLFLEIMTFLRGYNFALQNIYDPYFSTSQILWCDSLFVSKNYF